MRYQPEIQTLSIVLLGKFNPAIFSPSWIAKANIITDAEAEAATVNLIHPEISQFAVEKFRFEVQKERFQITTSVEPFVRLLEAVLNLFKEQLPHTPADKMGINYEVHFQLESFDRRVALGRRLAPLEPWGDFGKRLEGGKELESVGGMMALVMQENCPPGRVRGWRRVHIEPSAQIKGLTGVRMHINDHYEMIDARDEDGSARIMAVLRDRFDASLAEARKIVSDLMDFASKLP